MVVLEEAVGGEEVEVREEQRGVEEMGHIPSGPSPSVSANLIVASGSGRGGYVPPPVFSQSQAIVVASSASAECQAVSEQISECPERMRIIHVGPQLQFNLQQLASLRNASLPVEFRKLIGKYDAGKEMIKYWDTLKEGNEKIELAVYLQSFPPVGVNMRSQVVKDIKVEDMRKHWYQAQVH
jgi:hypothetical protein